MVELTYATMRQLATSIVVAYGGASDGALISVRRAAQLGRENHGRAVIRRCSCATAAAPRADGAENAGRAPCCVVPHRCERCRPDQSKLLGSGGRVQPAGHIRSCGNRPRARRPNAAPQPTGALASLWIVRL